MKITDCR